MADNGVDLRRESRAGWAFMAIAFIVILGLLVSYALPHPHMRKYPRRVPVRLWHMWTGEWAVVIDRICQRFNESQDKYEAIPLSIPGAGEADSKFLLAASGGDPPDIISNWDPVMPKWAESHLIVPLDEFMTPQQKKDYLEDWYEPARKCGSYKGRLYGVTTGLNTWALFYRSDQLAEAGLDPNHFPQTLEGLLSWGKKLDRYDSRGDLVRIGFMPEGLGIYAPSFGEGFYDWKHDRLTLNTPENLRALEFLVEQRKRLGFDRVVRFASGLNNGATGTNDWPFINGSFSITYWGQWGVEQLNKYAPEVDYGTVPLPPPAGGRKYGGFVNGNFLMIPKDAKHPDGAWEFIKFWSGIEEPERAAEFYTWGGWLPLRRAITAAPKYQEYVRKYPKFKTFLDILPSENLQPIPPVPFQMYLLDEIGRIDDLAIRGTLTPKEALDLLESDIAHEQARRKEFGYRD